MCCLVPLSPLETWIKQISLYRLDSFYPVSVMYTSFTDRKLCVCVSVCECLRVCMRVSDHQPAFMVVEGELQCRLVD